MSTPESQVKKDIKRVLAYWKTKLNIHIWMPVPNGYGISGLDFHCVVVGHCLIIEAKAPGGEPTPRQRQALVEHHTAGATCFIISNREGLTALNRWFERFHASYIAALARP